MPPVAWPSGWQGKIPALPWARIFKFSSILQPEKMKKNHLKISTQLNMSLEVEGLEQFTLVRESLTENWYALVINDLFMKSVVL